MGGGAVNGGHMPATGASGEKTAPLRRKNGSARHFIPESQEMAAGR